MKTVLLLSSLLPAAWLVSCASPAQTESAPIAQAPVAEVPVADSPIVEASVEQDDTEPAVAVVEAPANTVVLSAPDAPTASPTPSPATPIIDRAQRFEMWKAGFIDRMSARHDPAIVRSLLEPMTLRENLLDRDTTQPEFTRPIWSYLDSALKESRVGPGRENLELYNTTFRQIAQRYRVDAAYLTAIWGMESQYGAIMGDNPVVDALATFAFEGRRERMFTNQLEALVELVADGVVRQDQLLGSWAGAMGMTQFMPAAMKAYAVDMDGDGNIDLRGSEADALGSAAHYLSRSGWVAGQPAMVEVRVPDGFDYGLGDGSTRRSASEWLRLGVRPVGDMAGSLVGADAKLLIPAGANGPKFLTFKNFDVIKKYNNSTSYAMAISGLAETFKGNVPVTTPWPRDDAPVSFDDKTSLQERLTQLGYDTNGIDGVVGPGTRAAVRAFQKANGLVADGYVTQALIAQVMGAR